jgi:hypothetical protein
MLIAPQLPPVLHRRSLAILPMRTDQIDAPAGQALLQRVRITNFTISQPLGALAGRCRPATTARAACERRKTWASLVGLSTVSKVVSASLQKWLLREHIVLLLGGAGHRSNTLPVGMRSLSEQSDSASISGSASCHALANWVAPFKMPNPQKSSTTSKAHVLHRS